MNQPVATSPKENLLNEFNAVVTETEHLLKSVASLGSEKAGVLKGNVDQALVSATDRLVRLREQSLAQASAAAAAADKYVNDDPWRALRLVAMAAAVAGLVAGLVIAKR